jgi:hypothetical protein
VRAVLTAGQLANRIVMETPRVLERSTTRLLAMKYLRTRLCVAFPPPLAICTGAYRHPRCSGGGKRYVTLLMALLRSAHTSPTLLAAVCDEVRSFCGPVAGVLTAGRSRRWRQNRRPMRPCVRLAWLASCASSCSVTVRLRSITLFICHRMVVLTGGCEGRSASAWHVRVSLLHALTNMVAGDAAVATAAAQLVRNCASAVKPSSCACPLLACERG